MAKQRVRRIVVDDSTYQWRVRMIDPNWVSVRVWRDGEKVPWADVRVRFDDPWLLYPEMLLTARHAPERFDDLFAREPMRPGRVAELIRALGHHSGPSREFELVDGEVKPIPVSL